MEGRHRQTLNAALEGGMLTQQLYERIETALNEFSIERDEGIAAGLTALHFLKDFRRVLKRLDEEEQASNE